MQENRDLGAVPLRLEGLPRKILSATDEDFHHPPELRGGVHVSSVRKEAAEIRAGACG
jgi:hypothetical protein